MTRAVLQTSRLVERGVQYYGPDVNTVAILADKWLDANGASGDKFYIYEEALVRVVAFNQVTVGIETEPTRAPVPVLHHSFVPGSGVHCDRCGCTKASHPEGGL